MTDLTRIRSIVTSWTSDTELSAARYMYEIAKVLGVEPPKPVAGKVRRPEQPTRTEPLPEKATSST